MWMPYVCISCASDFNIKLKWLLYVKPNSPCVKAPNSLYWPLQWSHNRLTPVRPCSPGIVVHCVDFYWSETYVIESSGNYNFIFVWCIISDIATGRPHPWYRHAFLLLPPITLDYVDEGSSTLPIILSNTILHHKGISYSSSGGRSYISSCQEHVAISQRDNAMVAQFDG